jgi:formylglycine-generating enzyme required for sulfatase activity
VAGHANQVFELLPLPGVPLPISLPFEAILIPAGPFHMGSIPGPGIPAHEIPPFELMLPAYRIGKYPVTNEQYAEYVRAAKLLVGPDLEWDGQTVPAAKSTHPVAGVAWYEAVAYCQWIGAKTGVRCTLPTEAQWEKAARGTDGRLYPWGNLWEDGRSNQGGVGTAPVDAYPPQSPYGCCDMVGNVRQWTRSLWGERLRAPDEAWRYPWQADAVPPDASDVVRRVWRGASYADAGAQLLCAARGALFPARTGPPGLRMGFRVAINDMQNGLQPEWGTTR